jgi:hypothetical protein
MSDLATRFIPAPPGPRLSPVLPPLPLAGALRAIHRLLAKHSLHSLGSCRICFCLGRCIPQPSPDLHPAFTKKRHRGPSFPACFFSNHTRFPHTRTLASSCFPPLRHPPRVRFDRIALCSGSSGVPPIVLFFSTPFRAGLFFGRPGIGATPANAVPRPRRDRRPPTRRPLRTKFSGVEQDFLVLGGIEHFWLSVVRLASPDNSNTSPP